MRASNLIVQAFVENLRRMGYEVQKSLVIKKNVFVLNQTCHVLVRTSKYFHGRGYYFFGLTKSVLENFAKIPCAFIAFICGDIDKSYIVRASDIYDQRTSLSKNAAQYKLVVGPEGHIHFPKGSHATFDDLGPFLNKYDILNKYEPTPPTTPTKEGSEHSTIQGMLLEIGNLRGYQTYTPNKSARFAGRPLLSIASLPKFPDMSVIRSKVAKRVDVLWFQDEFPAHAFEIELSTGIWSGLVRLGEFARLSTQLHVITNGRESAFKKRVGTYIFRPILTRCAHASTSQIRKLYTLETKIGNMRKELAL